MVEAQLTYFDMAVFGVMFLSCLFAFFRGFVREILSLIGWIGSGYITIKFFNQVTEALLPHFAKPFMAMLVAIGALYIGSLIAFAIANRIIIKILKSGDIGFMDNLLGLAFGAVRGALMVALGFFMITAVISKEKAPDWFKKSLTLPYAEKSTELLKKLIPKEELEKLEDTAKKSAEKKSGEEGDGKDDEPKENGFQDFINNLQNDNKNNKKTGEEK